MTKMELKSLLYNYFRVYKDYASSFEDPAGSIVGEGKTVKDSFKDLMDIFTDDDKEALLPFWFPGGVVNRCWYGSKYLFN